MGFVVAVDGPAGSGKGTITKKIAERNEFNKYRYRSNVQKCYTCNV